MYKSLSIIGLALLMSACSSAPNEFTPRTTVRVVNTTVYPDLPQVPAVPDPGLIPWSYDFPRDTSKVTVKNITKCVEVAEADQDTDFWNRCGENPILSDTNIFIGLTRENWDILNSNLKKLQENIYLYRRRIEQINRQREEWRQKASEERNPANSVLPQATELPNNDVPLGTERDDTPTSIFGFKF